MKLDEIADEASKLREKELAEEMLEAPSDLMITADELV